MPPRIMYIEPGGGLARTGGRIGRVHFSKSGRTLKYDGQCFQSLSGTGYKANYFNVATGEWFWICGPRRDGRDALYSMVVEVDEDVRDDYWLDIRSSPELKHTSWFRSVGKYSSKKPQPSLSVSGGTRIGGNRGGSVIRGRSKS